MDVGPACRQQVGVGTADRQSAGSSCGFADFGRFDLWRLSSCSIRRKQVGVGTDDRVNPSVASSDSSPFRRACTPRPCLPFQESPGRDEYASPERGGACCAGGGVQNEEFGNSNVWFPNSSMEPAEASACRLSLPGGQTSVGVWGSAKRSGASPSGRRSGAEPRRPWPLQFMAANGRRQNRRQQVEPGTARRQQVGAGSACPVREVFLYEYAL